VDPWADGENHGTEYPSTRMKVDQKREEDKKNAGRVAFTTEKQKKKKQQYKRICIQQKAQKHRGVGGPT